MAVGSVREGVNLWNASTVGGESKRPPLTTFDVLAMLVNYRLVTTPVATPEVYERYWCYAGTGPLTFVTAVLAAEAWDGSPDSEPVGWNKNGQTGEWRPPGDTRVVTPDDLVRIVNEVYASE